MPDINRQLIQANNESYHGWVCSHCGQQFLSSGWDIFGLTREQALKHFTIMRERAFATHECVSTLKCE
jgi:hypothetical protein